MTLLEIDDKEILSMLPATCPQIAVRMSGTTDKKSLQYRRYQLIVNRHLNSMSKQKMVKWEWTINRAKLWELC